MRGENLLTEKEQKRMYLLHHMHHFRKERKKVMHDLHHCYLFQKKNKKGEKFQIKHLLAKKKLFHVLNKKYSGYLYDHANNRFKITEKNINNKKYFVIN